MISSLIYFSTSAVTLLPIPYPDSKHQSRSEWHRASLPPVDRFSHLAYAKLEILSAAVASVGGDLQTIRSVLDAKTADAAYKILVQLQLAESVFTY